MEDKSSRARAESTGSRAGPAATSWRDRELSAEQGFGRALEAPGDICTQSVQALPDPLFRL